MPTDPSAYRFEDFELIAAQRRLTRAGQEVALQPKAFDTLLFLLQRADRVVTKAELLDGVWPRVVVTDNVLARVISALRRALGDEPARSRYIRSVARVGYRFVGPLAPAEPGASPPSLAVLPFQPLPGGARDASLELGMADTLIAQLGRIGAVRVRPLATVAAVTEACELAQDAAQRLQVDAYLEASIQRGDDRVRVVARLVRTDDAAVLWSQSFNEPFEHIFALQDTISARIVAELAPQLPHIGVAQRPTAPAAYSAFLEGRLFLARHTPTDLARAAASFDDAIDVDPGYAPAWAGLAEACTLLGTLGVDPPRHYHAARRAGRRALALDPDLAGAQCALASIAWQHDWNWAQADRLFDDALRRHPVSAELHIACADFQSFMRRSDLAIEHARQALLVDPVSPWINTLLAQTLYMGGHDQEALAQCDRALALAPGFAFAQFFGGLARFHAGEHDQGIAWIERAVASGRADFAAALGLCYALSGRQADAEGVLERVRSQGDAAPPIAAAVVLLGLGRVTEAVAELARCLEERDWHVLLLHADPLVRACAASAEVRAMLASLRLPRD